MKLLENFHDKRVYFIGIGGVSMSGLASILHHQGAIVSGSDRSASDYTRYLQDSGITVHIGHNAAHINNIDYIIETGAISPDNVEHQAALAANIPILSRSDLLQQINTAFPVAVGISGTHGKTTTSAMAAAIFMEAGLDPTVHVGAKMDFLRGSVRVGNSPLFLTEACEYREQFLRFPATIAAVLNIDADHLDYFRDIDHIYSAFETYVEKLPADGRLIGCMEDPLVRRLMENCHCPTVGYGWKQGEWQAWDAEPNENGCFSYTVMRNGAAIGCVQLSIPGRHNILNSLAALAVCSEAAEKLGHSTATLIPAFLRGLHDFTGADRRFKRMGQYNNAAVFLDYAHHPTEVAAVIDAARPLVHNGKLWVVFQPHTYTRTLALFDETARCLALSDRAILLDIYAAREPDPGNISAAMLTNAVNDANGSAEYSASFEDAAILLHQQLQPGDVVLVLGAGSIEQLAPMIVA